MKNLTQQEIIEELRGFIRKRFEVPETDRDFNDGVHLFDYGYVDSFGAVELTGFVERKFSVKISDTDLVTYPLNSIEEIATFVEGRKEGRI